MVAGGGGRLIAAIRRALDDVEADAGYLATQVPQFILDTRWPSPYDVGSATFTKHASVFAYRVKWSGATRAYWPALVSSRIESVLEGLPVLRQIFRSLTGQPQVICWEIDKLGDSCLVREASAHLLLFAHSRN